MHLRALASDSVFSRLSRNTLTLLVSNGGGALLSFALSVLIGRALGEDGLGVYAAALAWVFPLWLLAEFGFETLITREVAQNPTAAPDYLRAAAIARLTLGGGLMLLLLLAAPFITDDAVLAQGLRIAAPLIVVGPFASAFSAVFRAHRVMWPVAALNIGMLALQLPLTALVLVQGGGVLAALAVNTLTSAGQLVAAWAIYRVRFQAQARA
ncbi:MAG TPA: oligosaccharide flippase family protein, partial [Spirillospora sp.]|nr:oligosaccharide flippase family protein [Spirillospora sp.]